MIKLSYEPEAPLKSVSSDATFSTCFLLCQGLFISCNKINESLSLKILMLIYFSGKEIGRKMVSKQTVPGMLLVVGAVLLLSISVESERPSCPRENESCDIAGVACCNGRTCVNIGFAEGWKCKNGKDAGSESEMDANSENVKDQIGAWIMQQVRSEKW